MGPTVLYTVLYPYCINMYNYYAAIYWYYSSTCYKYVCTSGTLHAFPESHSNLSKYRSAIYHFRQEARIIDRVKIDDAKIGIYEDTLTGFFNGVRRDEGKLTKRASSHQKKMGLF